MMFYRYLKPLDEVEIVCNGFVSLGHTVFGNYHRMLFDLILQFRIQ
jgi:hypothetical protein